MDESSHPSAAYGEDQQKLAGMLFDNHYEELLRIARSKRRRSPQTISLMTIDVLHESYLKLRTQKQFVSDEHFMSSAALAIRHVITDYARARVRQAQNGASKANADTAERLFPEYAESPEQIIEISDLLQKLEIKHPRWLRILDARYFAGMSEEETAEVLGMSQRTVRRDLHDVRAWLAEQLGLSKA